MVIEGNTIRELGRCAGFVPGATEIINVVTLSAVTTRETVNSEGGMTKREGYCEYHDAQKLFDQRHLLVWG
jgi:hypothetical protein